MLKRLIDWVTETFPVPFKFLLRMDFVLRNRLEPHLISLAIKTLQSLDHCRLHLLTKFYASCHLSSLRGTRSISNLKLEQDTAFPAPAMMRRFEIGKIIIRPLRCSVEQQGRSIIHLLTEL